MESLEECVKKVANLMNYLRLPRRNTEEIKKKRLQEIVEIQNRLSLQSNKKDVGKTFKVLIEGDSRRSEKNWTGRNSQNKVIVFPKENYELKKGDYVTVKVTDCTQATLLGEIA